MVEGTTDNRMIRMAEFTARICSFDDLSGVMPVVLGEVVKMLGAERGALVVKAGSRGPQLFTTQSSHGKTSPSVSGGYSRTVIDQVMRDEKPLVTTSASTDRRLSASATVQIDGLVSIVCVPLMAEGRVVGAIYLDSSSPDSGLGASAMPFLQVLADMIAAALVVVRSRDRLRDTARLSETCLATLDLSLVLDRIVIGAVQLSRADQGFLILIDEHGIKGVRVGVDHSGNRLLPHEAKHLSWTVVNQVLSTGEGVISSNLSSHPLFGLAASAHDLKSVLCVPLRSPSGTLGAIYLQCRVHEGVFDQEDLACVSILAKSAVLALTNARIHAREKMMVKALANAMEFRDAQTSGHVQRVVELAAAVGKRLGLSPDALTELEQAAVLHDIGKIGVPDRVLLKPDRLDAEEWKTMKTHPEIGVQIVDPVELPRPVRDGILSHQERWDGKGYPKGLKREDIPLFGRILAVVDSFDAMVSDRPYRKGMPREEAIAEIKKGAGTQYDPAVVAEFLAVMEQKEPDAPAAG